MSICTQCGGEGLRETYCGESDDHCEKCGMTESGAAMKARVAELEAALVDLIGWTSVDMVELQREGHTVSHLAASIDRAQRALEGGQ